MQSNPSYNLGLWRGAYERVRDVPLDSTIDVESYRDGYDHGWRNRREIRAAARRTPKPGAAKPAPARAPRDRR